MKSRLISTCLVLLFSLCSLTFAYGEIDYDRTYETALNIAKNDLSNTSNLNDAIIMLKEVGAYKLSHSYLIYFQQLVDIQSDTQDLENALLMFELCGNMEPFTEDLQARGLPSCTDLLTYTNARILEDQGKADDAYTAYRTMVILDAPDRAMNLAGIIAKSTPAPTVIDPFVDEETKYDMTLDSIAYPDLERSLKDLETAYENFMTLASYKNSTKYTLYTKALLDIAGNKYEEANITLTSLSDYPDFCEELNKPDSNLPAVEKIRTYLEGRIAEDQMIFSIAIEKYISADVLDSVSRVNTIRTEKLPARFIEAVEYENAGNYDTAMVIYQDLSKAGYSAAVPHSDKITNWMAKMVEAKNAEASGAYTDAQVIYSSMNQDGYLQTQSEYDRVTAIISGFTAADAAITTGDYTAAQNQLNNFVQAGYIGASEKLDKLNMLVNALALDAAGDYTNALAAYKSLVDSGYGAASNPFANLLQKKRDEMNGYVNTGSLAEAESIFSNLILYIPDLQPIVTPAINTPFDTPLTPEATPQPVPVMEIVGSKLNDAHAYQVFFNASYYAANNPDVVAQYGTDEKSLKKHWINHGMKEGRNGSPVLDVAYYLQMNPDVAQAYGKNYIAVQLHFYEKGIVERRVSSPAFNSYDYMALNPEVVVACKGDIRKCAMHYNDTGYNEGRQAIFSK